MAWYNAGTVSVTNGSKRVTGNGTLWASQVARGDLFSLDGVTLLAIDRVIDDTHLDLLVVYAGATASGQAYTIERAGASGAAPNTQDFAEFVARQDMTISELAAWLTASGITTITNPVTGATVSVKTPTQIDADYAAALAAIIASQTAAEAANTDAQWQVTLAQGHANTAAGHAGTATTKAAEVLSNTGIAQAQATIATDQATLAKTYADAAHADKVATTTQAGNAAAYANAAATSEAIVQTLAASAEANDISSFNSKTDAEAAAGIATSAASSVVADALNVHNDRLAVETYVNSAQNSASSAAADRVQTSLDRTQTGLDATATAADRVQTGLDKQEAQTAKTDSQTAAANSAASANNAANSVVSQLSTIKTQTETARDQALAGLGAADNSQILAVLMGESSFLMDMIGQSIKELYRYEGVTDPRLVAIEPAVDVLAQGLVDLADLLGVTARAVSGGDIMVRLGTVDNPSISIFGNRNTGFYSPAANQLAVTTNGVQRLLIDASGNHLTGTDNAQTLGSAAKRWSTVYAGTGTINTSDAREKTAVASLTADEIAAAKDLSKEVGTYQFLDSIAAKGNAARHHVGMTVQRAIQIMQAHNLDPMRYGFICYDAWPAVSIEHPAVAAVPEVLDADGNILEMGTPAQAAWTEVIQTAGDRYSFRYDQLNLFIAAGLNARLAALETI